jgi:hypothetical protein
MKTETVERTDKTAEEALHMADDDEKARIAQILSMGLVSDMIAIKDGSPDRRYVWVRERDIDIEKFKLLGYGLELEVGEGEHDTGDSVKRTGDCVLMSVDKDRYALIEGVKAEQRARRAESPIRDYKNQAQRGVDQGTAVSPLDFTGEA